MEGNHRELRFRGIKGTRKGILVLLVAVGASICSLTEPQSQAPDRKAEPTVIEVYTPSDLRTSWTGFRAVLNSQGSIDRVEALGKDGQRRVLPMSKGDDACTSPTKSSGTRLMAEDLNFDGYPDLAVLCAEGATGNRDYSVWLWDHKKQMLRFSSDFSGILEHVKSLAVNPSERTVTTTQGDLRTRLEHTYAIVNDKPRLSRSRFAEVNKDGVWDITISERQGERMVVREKRQSQKHPSW